VTTPATDYDSASHQREQRWRASALVHGIFPARSNYNGGEIDGQAVCIARASGEASLVTKPSEDGNHPLPTLLALFPA
jgi:hypothetical protein